MVASWVGTCAYQGLVIADQMWQKRLAIHVGGLWDSGQTEKRWCNIHLRRWQLEQGPFGDARSSCEKMNPRVPVIDLPFVHRNIELS
jgi:hypothetical protein